MIDRLPAHFQLQRYNITSEDVVKLYLERIHFIPLRNYFLH
jgi:hypothetical protein